MNQKLRTETHKLSWWENVLRGQNAGFFAQSLRRAARIGSWGYRVSIRGREVAYQRGWLPVKRLPRPTVCVGNITVGGTGKTPLVIRLVNDLLKKGLRPAVLLRGYKRERTLSLPVLVRDPKAIRATVQESGDEAMELAVRLPGACVGVGADRHAVGRSILRQYPVDCFVLDDGFQHYRLERDMNIVTLDVTDPWGGGQLLPAGLLRESPEALRRADLVVLTRTGLVAPDRLAVLRAEVASLLKDPLSLIESHHQPRVLIGLNGKEYPLSSLKGRRVLAVSAIGNPRSFETTLLQEGAEIEDTLRLADHEGNPGDVWTWISERQKPGQWILMTEKDAMRWTTNPMTPAQRMITFALRMDLILTSGETLWGQVIERLRCLSHAKAS